MKIKAKKSGNLRRPSKHIVEQNDRTQERWAHEIARFDRVYKKLIGRGAMIITAGKKCQHTPDEFRPLHVEPGWPTRPAFNFLTVGEDKMMLSVARSLPRDNKLSYMNGNGELPCAFDFYQMPRKGARGEVLDGFKQHELFTLGCNMLQTLLDTVDTKPNELQLPELLICSKVPLERVQFDEGKLDALADMNALPELREEYKQKKREEAAVYSLGQLFIKAEVLSDDDIKTAFAEKRAYEDYAPFLGPMIPNPVKKILLASNPARQVLAEAGLPSDWAATATTELVDKLIKEMRCRIPLPARALDSDIIDALEQPESPLKFSVAIEKLPPSMVVKAMKDTFPTGAAIRYAVADEDLLAAAKAPYSELRVKHYSKIQVFSLESIALPNYAVGSFFARPRATGLELA